MSNATPTSGEATTSLIDHALGKLAACTDGMIRWAEMVRPKDSPQGRFTWALQTTRDANVASTAYMLMGLKRMGIYNRVVTDTDRGAGQEWVLSMRGENDQYRDSALFDRKPPGWPEGEPWPSVSMKAAVNQYAASVLRDYGFSIPNVSPPPPPELPQADDPRGAVEWIKTRPWDTNAWGAGSHAMRMATWLMQWHKEGKLPIDPLIEALKFFYEIQDPETGLWGSPSLPRYNRINGTFKLFPLIRESLDLPLPHAEKIIDQVMAEFLRPDYDEHVGGCDEWDNWYVLALALEKTESHRLEEIRRMAAYRIARVIDIFSKPDGGFSYDANTCQTHWVDCDMAPKVAQSDAIAPAVLTAGINVCIDLLGIQDRTTWTGVWRMREKESSELRAEIEARVFG